MKQAKKIFTRILMNNWGGIDHQVLCLNEYVNLFSGKSGSGKSSVMDAMQVVLYGSVGNDFLNRAADDSANKRSVLSYLRGEQKDGTANRENQDFYAHIVLEIQDTGRKSYTCIGAVFEVGKNDMDLKRFRFSAMPENFWKMSMSLCLEFRIQLHRFRNWSMKENSQKMRKAEEISTGSIRPEKRI